MSLLSNVGPRFISRKIRNPEIIRNNGIFIRLPNDVHPDLRDRIYKNKYERREMALLRETVHKYDIVLDVGSGIGQTAILCASITNNKVFAVEANPDLIPIITDNASLNNANVEAIHGAISSNHGTSEFYISDRFYASSLEPCDCARKITVPLVQISSILDDKMPTYISMDAEGAEYSVLPYVKRSQVRAITVETHDNGSEEALIRRMLENGFSLAYNSKNILHFN